MFVREPFTLLGLVISPYLALSIASLAGLLLLRPWGFYALYVLIPYSTVMLSVSFVPLPLSVLPLESRWIGLMVLNIAVLFLGAISHYYCRAQTMAHSVRRRA
jgi:hypothetical protein